MLTAHATRHQSCTASGAMTFSWLAQPVTVLAVWRQRARTRQQLLRLNEHDLRDIGLTRHQVMMECNKPLWRG